MLAEENAPPKRSGPSRIERIRFKQGKKTCPNCHESMPYRAVSMEMSQWSPGLYAWFCPRCPIAILDGTIMPDETTWANDDKERQDQKLRQSLGAIFKK